VGQQGGGGEEDAGPAAGTCAALLEAAAAEDAEREQRQQGEYLAGLPNIWLPDAEKKLMEARAAQQQAAAGRADAAPQLPAQPGALPATFTPDTAGLLGRRYAEVGCQRRLVCSGAALVLHACECRGWHGEQRSLAAMPA
jgi:hypothetical protein